MVRLNLRAKRFPALPLTKRGERLPKCSNTSQKSFSAISEDRTLLELERLLRLGGVAPRRLESGPEFNPSASQTSLSPMLCVSWAYKRETTWLHALNERTFFSTPVSRANLGTKKSGMKLQICRSRFNFEGAGTLLFLFFIPAVWQG